LFWDPLKIQGVCPAHFGLYAIFRLQHDAQSL
jgi:hypothetical protein